MSKFAFPVSDGAWESREAGLTKRELFAAMAMQSLLTLIRKDSLETHSDLIFAFDVVAEDSVKMADLLLGALEDRPPP